MARPPALAAARFYQPKIQEPVSEPNSDPKDDAHCQEQLNVTLPKQAQSGIYVQFYKTEDKKRAAAKDATLII